MPYNATLDECLFTKTWENETGRLVVAVYSYNKAAKKLQISREGKTAEGEFRFAKLGRVAKDELEAILPFIQEALKHM